jgi:putative membrane protein
MMFATVLLAKEILDVAAIASAAIYSVLGLVIFAIVWMLIVWLTPFSIRKEIEDDQNTSLGIILGAVIIGISLIISAAVAG